MANNNESIFSLRLVIADFYMEKPIPGLDPVYSEFRGKEIKKVPIIRVFGPNAQGQKTCMHVHGVFPYFYVPYDQKDFESVNKAIYQIAINLDKAINISLSQGSSGVQHVFKVQLVKGIPFYGYHRSEHQYLKIYMFNPRFVRRAANLLQNGAIMNKNFHPHEAHVPYILQFMIDYNLYGMSFIHVPSEIIKFRRSDGNGVIPFKNLKEAQILDCEKAKKLSCSTLECDIGSNFILNRFQLVTKTASATHSNPGIESIWNDEKLRRQKMAQAFEEDEEKLKAIPPLEVPSTQERPNVYPTESETFYRTALVSKLLAMETSMMENTQLSDQTINCTFQSNITNITNTTLNTSLATAKHQKRTFNLTKMLQNAVYPEECSQNDNLTNASFVENHLSNNNAFQQSLCMDLPALDGSENRKLSEDESVFLDDTIIDEELVLSLTQSHDPHVPHNATLRDEDMQLLDILQQLEEDNSSEKIDLDSSLAPLSQNQNYYALSPELLDKETTAAAMQQSTSDVCSNRDDEDEADDNIHDFSIALENLDDLILKLTQTATEQSIICAMPQNDGSDDLPRTPTKPSISLNNSKTPPRTPTTPTQRRLTLGSPSRSPRTPKSGHKYKPLPLIITNRSTGKQILTKSCDNGMTPCKETAGETSKNLSTLLSLRKKLALTELRRKSISVETDVQDNLNELPVITESSNVTKRRSKRMVNLDKTHVTCNLTPRRTNEKLLKVYSVENNENGNAVTEEEPGGKEKLRQSIPDIINKSKENSQHSKENNKNDEANEYKASGGNATNYISPKANVKRNEKEITSSDHAANLHNHQNSQQNPEDIKRTNREENQNAEEDRNNASNIGEDNEEILDSDNETEYPSTVQLRKTPNLKRLRRSFLSKHSAKRRKMASRSEELGEVINSSKFQNPNISSNSPNEEEKDVEKQTKQILAEQHVNTEIKQYRCKENSKNIEHSKGLLEEVSKEPFRNVGTSTILRKSKRIASHHSVEEKLLEQPKDSIFRGTKESSTIVEVEKGMVNRVKNCCVRLRKISKESLKTSKDIETMKTEGHIKTLQDRRRNEIEENLQLVRISNATEKNVNEIQNEKHTEELKVHSNSPENESFEEIVKKKSELGVVKVPQRNKIRETHTNMLKIKEIKIPQLKADIQRTQRTSQNSDVNRETIDNAQHFHSADFSDQKDMFSRSQHVIPSSNDNLFKALFKLTTESEESIKCKELSEENPKIGIIDLSKESLKNSSADTTIEKMSNKKCILEGVNHTDLRTKQNTGINKPTLDNSQMFHNTELSQEIEQHSIPSSNDNLLNALLKLTSETQVNAKEKSELGIAKLPTLSEESVRTSEAINFKKISPRKDLLGIKDLREDTQTSLRTTQISGINNRNLVNSQPFCTSDLSQQVKPFRRSSFQQHIPSSNDNILKVLLRLTSIGQNECLPSSSENVSDSPKNSRNMYQSQSPPVEFMTDSPFSQSSDDEIAETPPTPPSTYTMKQTKLSRLSERNKTLNSPLLFTQNSSPSVVTQNQDLGNAREETIAISSSNESTIPLHSPPLETRVILTPLDLPPTRDEVLKGCLKLKLPEYDFQQPFYSNPDDVTKHKEIGFTVLQIQSNKLNDMEEFQSILGNDVKGLAAWRRQQLARLGGPEMLTKYRNSQRIREYFATQKVVEIEPQVNAPTRQDVKLWLKARELLKSKGGGLNEPRDEVEGHPNQEDSPIKIRRQKVTMMLNPEGGGGGEDDDSDNSLDCSSMSLNLTPLTPGTPVTKDSLSESINKSFTPVTTKIEKIPLERINPLRRRHNNRRVLKRISLNAKLKEALDREKSSQSQENSQENEVVPVSADESIIPHSSQNSETSISSQTALAEMERSSFMHQIHAHDATMAGGGSNESTLNNTFGFKVALENLQQAKADIEFNYLTIITLEVFVATRDDLFPNPQIDEIRCLFYAIENSIPSDHTENDKKLPRKACGYIMVHDPRDMLAKEGHIHGLDRDIEVTIVHTEVEALEALLGLCSRWDPDIYAGYEIEMCSWGFVMDRAKYLCLNIAPLLSRVPTQKMRDFQDEDRDQFTDLDVEMKLCGRILLDVWRLMRSEIALTSYTFENVMYHIMHKRCPCHSYRSLTEWYFSPGSRWIVLEYYLERVRGTLGLLDQLDLIGRTSEMAKLIGIQFYEVLSRGSQFRVESMMLRIAKPKNLVPVSPSVQQRAHMRAPEYLPLILEPQSRFYADPLIVLDFQSLYPSMIIGYNYCFSTCLGRVEHLGQSTPFEFGASQLRVSPTMLRKLVDRDLITISPCGVVFVKSSVREGILPRMLTEILDTRQMVKQSMKVHKSNSALQRILHSRQLGLKLMANVTYGYTAANFSGRMPAVEVGDTVVAKGRETLERAIKMVQANEKWNVKVVYGDTDSLFVLVPGRNREEAFRIGEEIAEAVTKQNPHPVKLKLEKVYQPCILQTKKRYVGYMYETADQKDPIYEAKGIETVRRDGCPMVAKMLEKVLRILFESADVSQVKQYVCRQFTKLLSGRPNIQDLIFAKEFRGMNGYKPNACVPALELTRKWLQTDPRRIPRRGERVPFIITNGPPGVPLIRLIRHPHEVLADEGLKINAVYYITKAIIPPLNRCLLLIGADVNEWFTNLPRKILMTPALSMANEVIACPNNKSKKSTISQFFSTTNCIVDCGRQTKHGICDVCSGNATRSMVTLQTKISKIERGYLTTQHICQACCGRVGDLKCSSLDCPVLYVLEVKRRDLQQIVHFRNLLEERF